MKFCSNAFKNFVTQKCKIKKEHKHLKPSIE